MVCNTSKSSESQENGSLHRIVWPCLFGNKLNLQVVLTLVRYPQPVYITSVHVSTAYSPQTCIHNLGTHLCVKWELAEDEN